MYLVNSFTYLKAMSKIEIANDSNRGANLASYKLIE